MAAIPETSAIQGYHAHVYYDAATLDPARRLCETASRRFGLEMGRMHQQEVGPHPRWSCQLSVPPHRFGEVIPWLALNRGALTVFVHVRTGDDLLDHTQGEIWLGPSVPLKLEMFGKA